jgi:methyltransferase (TIGR00027 family)
MWRAAHRFLERPPYVLEDTVGLQLASEPQVLGMMLDSVPDAATMDQIVDSLLRTDSIASERIRPFRAAVVARARFAEDLVRELLTGGVRQYVILGAGLDTFTVRHPELDSGLDVFEVDGASTQGWKRRRLEKLGFASANLHFASVDFEDDPSWVKVIRRVGFDPAQPALTALLGVTQYISPAALQATMREAAKLSPGSRFVCSFILPTDRLNADEREVVAEVGRRAAARGHAWVSRFQPEQLIVLAQRAGFSDVRDVSSEELTQLYFADRTDGFHPTRAEHLLVATV